MRLAEHVHDLRVRRLRPTQLRLLETTDAARAPLPRASFSVGRDPPEALQLARQAQPNNGLRLRRRASAIIRQHADEEHEEQGPKT